jgi:GNAT superfamily N-acetyltransferase
MSRLRNGWGYLRQYGVRPALQTSIHRYIYRSEELVVVGSQLAGPPADDRTGDVVFRLATPSDLEHLDELEPYGRGSSQRAYVEQAGDWLFVACHGDRIAATARYCRTVRDQLVSRVVQLEQGQVWGADQFCVPEYRNRGISRLLSVFANRHLAALGYTDVASSVLVTNTASLRMTLHKNRPFCYVSYSRLLFWERLRVSKDIPAEFWDRLK